NENSDWLPANDPCALELGGGWHMPSYTEWNNVVISGGWTDWNGPWNSGLKIHVAGYLDQNIGSLDGRGSVGDYWGSQYSTTSGWYVRINSGSCGLWSDGTKSYGFSVRCLKDN
ncbi:MAG: hypothetical protein WCI71_06130, partial [Bacteroidota bacterium]